MRAAMAGAIRAVDNWVDGPASLLGERWQALRPGTRVFVELSTDGQALRVRSDARSGVPIAISLASADDLAVRAALRPLLADRQVTLRVPQGWVLERQVELPMEAAGHLEGIVASRVSTLSPVPPHETMFGHRLLQAGRASKHLSVGILILPRARLARALELLDGAAWRELNVEAPFASGDWITLFPRRSGSVGTRALIRYGVWTALVASVAAIALSLASGWIVDARYGGYRLELEANAAKARAAIAAAASPERAATAPEQAALDAKNDAISTLGALEDLAAALPMHAYATEISFADGRLKLSGRTGDVPDVLTALESSGRFLDSRLVGSARRAEDGVGSEFELETRPLIRTGGALK